jgi:hypothetical protein
VRDRLLGLAGVALAGSAAVWAVVGGTAAPVGTLAVVGLVFTLADAVVWRAAGDSGPDLAVPDGRRLPPPPFGVLVVAAAALGTIAGLATGALLVAAAVALVGAIALAVMMRPRDGAVIPVRTVNTARRLRAFVQAHGAETGQAAEGYLATVGESGGRLLVLAPDGAWADVLLGNDVAEVTSLARITLCDPDDPATGRRLRIGPGLWARMTDSW